MHRAKLPLREANAGQRAEQAELVSLERPERTTGLFDRPAVKRQVLK